MQTEPHPEHIWLQRFVGDWTIEIQAVMGPGEPPTTHTGRETVRSLGGLWIVAEGHGETPGGSFDSILTLGFDPQRRRFVGSFIASVMTHFWIYEGALDAAGKVLTLDCEGPVFGAEGKTTRYQDVHTWVSENERTLTGKILGPDGQWQDMMTSRYRRVRRTATQ
ncbi:MAG TPA: DUF1579 domain-containing protein [candidate division Zixibacteria bacterium]|nr:DUF1579 domain-containing protein [candidate division Zixibacteria bacterium]MDD4918327.1 DUF1579 domain-containing protein [candidate division Zixibacteria bacterium]MDM7974033.1 DUF1579 domain-containing protein [candidate division Zixibacteria bacterium]HOD67453.1 DUF1579 domain-containing protein [candidate division Zixibacteria bacterium]HOZ09150.1 DUF1579 domain-containing protein [candidate division Zixibacteria bacterium]